MVMSGMKKENSISKPAAAPKKANGTRSVRDSALRIQQCYISTTSFLKLRSHGLCTCMARPSNYKPEESLNMLIINHLDTVCQRLISCLSRQTGHVEEGLHECVDCLSQGSRDPLNVTRLHITATLHELIGTTRHSGHKEQQSMRSFKMKRSKCAFLGTFLSVPFYTESTLTRPSYWYQRHIFSPAKAFLQPHRTYQVCSSCPPPQPHAPAAPKRHPQSRSQRAAATSSRR